MWFDVMCVLFVFEIFQKKKKTRNARTQTEIDISMNMNKRKQIFYVSFKCSTEKAFAIRSTKERKEKQTLSGGNFVKTNVNLFWDSFSHGLCVWPKRASARFTTVSVFCTSLLRIFVMSVFFSVISIICKRNCLIQIFYDILFKHFFLNDIKYVHGWVKIKAPLDHWMKPAEWQFSDSGISRGKNTSSRQTWISKG